MENPSVIMSTGTSPESNDISIKQDLKKIKKDPKNIIKKQKCTQVIYK